MKLEEVVDYQNALLSIADYRDYPNALNGLQIEKFWYGDEGGRRGGCLRGGPSNGRLAGCGSVDRASRPVLGRLADGHRSALSQIENGS